MSQDYDAVFGADQATINNLIIDVYNALKPSGLFKQTIKVNEINISTVILDITKPFVVTLQPPPHLLPQLKSAIDSNKIPEESAKKILAAAMPIGITVNAPAINLTINYATGAPSTTLSNCSLSTGALVSTHGKSGTLTVQISSGSFSTNNPLMDEILNKSAVPYAIDVLNKNVFTSISVPSLSVKNVTVSLPVPVIQEPFLLAFTALGTAQPDVIPTYPGWPTGKVFVGVDAPLVVAGANVELPLNEGNTFSWTSFTGSYGATLGPVLSVEIESDATIKAKVKVSVNFNITFHTQGPLPNFSWSPSAIATVSADAGVNEVNSEIVVTFQSVDAPSFSFDWGSLDWVDWLLNPLLDGLGDALGDIVAPIVTGILKGHKFSVLQVPAIPVHDYNIILDNVQTAFASVNQKSLLLIEGIPKIMHK